MANCVIADQNGYLVLDANSAPPNCQSVLLAQSDYLDLQEAISNSIWNLSLAEGAQIAGAILLVWAVGYSFRLLIQFLKTTDEKETS